MREPESARGMTTGPALARGGSPGAAFRARAAIYLAFAATGVSLAMPGALMPWLLARWSLGDARAGLLLALFFGGGTAGALVTRGSLRWSLVRGACCTALGAAALPYATASTAYAAVLLFGTGLGLTMTTISLLQARRWPESCAVEMTRLNLTWAVGACASPWIVLHRGVLDGAHAARVLLAVAAGFGLFAVWAAVFEHDPLARPREVGRAGIGAGSRAESGAGRMGLLAVPFALLLLVFCATGVESSTGGWLATYSNRGGSSLGVTIGAPTCFWAGLLVSRLLQSSARVARASQGWLLTWNLVAMTAALAGLLVFHEGAPILACAFVLGFTAGPVYPLLLALVFRYEEGPMVFVLGGLGSAALPFLTGALSNAAGSLRAGLLVPCLAAAAMAAAGFRARRLG